MKKIYNSQTGCKLKIFHLENTTAEFKNKQGILENIIFKQININIF